MNLRKILVFLILSITIVIYNGANNNTVNAQINDNQFFNKEIVKNYLLEHSVPDEKVEILLKKLDNNEPWDCYQEEKLKNVPSDFDSFELNGGEEQVKYYRFEDGSFLLNELRTTEDSTYEEKEIITFERGVSNTAYGSQYTDYKISKSIGMITASFYADFWRARSGHGASQITKAFKGNVTGFGSNGSNTVQIERAVEDLIYKAPALASLQFKLTASVEGMTAGTTVYLVLALKNGTMNIYWD